MIILTNILSTEGLLGLIITTLLGGGIIGIFFNRLLYSKKYNMDIAKQLTDMYGDLINQQRLEIKELRVEMRNMQKHISQLESRNSEQNILIDELKNKLV